MRKIEMFNVGFGDCFILSEQNEVKSDGLLVDFGSEKSISPSLLSAVASKIVNEKIERCLLTHFHKDHYSGINELAKMPIMQKRFSEVILPNLYFNITAFKVQLFRLISLSKTGSAWSDAYNYISSTVHFSQLLADDGSFYYVSEGAKIAIGSSSYAVLAPNACDLQKIAQAELLSYAEKLISESVNEDMKKLYNDIVASAVRIMHFSNNEQNLNGRIVKKVSTDVGVVEALMTNIEKLAKLKLEINIEYEERKMLNRLQRSFSYDWNKLSIVFKTDDDSLVMTGDMKKRVWCRTVSNYCTNPINIFKAPHHGTKAYFSRDFPPINEYLISNAKHYNWDITELYPLHYSTSMFSCTNNDGSSANECGCSLAHSIERIY